MLELRILRNEKERVINGLKKRNLPDEAIALVDEIIRIDDTRKKSQSEMDSILAQINQISREVGELMKSGKREDAEALKSRVAQLKESNKVHEESLQTAQIELEEKLITLPNIPHISVPTGKTAEDNEVYKAWEGPMPELPENALPHWELAKKYQIFDMELGV